MADLRPLPRSLDPLSEESLPGYLLRLSHRLNISPLRLAVLTGLKPPRSAPSWSRVGLIHLPTWAREDFARTTRLSLAEVDDLTLATPAPRYPLSAPVRNGRWGSFTIPQDRWVFAPVTRCCSACLAGDGTAIQRAHGGAWRKVWHLPVVFACTEHRVLLRHRCPDCRQPVHAMPPRTATRVLPNMRNKGLHPAQCRATLTTGSGGRLASLCGTRLDATLAGEMPRRVTACSACKPGYSPPSDRTGQTRWSVLASPLKRLATLPTSAC